MAGGTALAGLYCWAAATGSTSVDGPSTAPSRGSSTLSRERKSRGLAKPLLQQLVGGCVFRVEASAVGTLGWGWRGSPAEWPGICPKIAKMPKICTETVGNKTKKIFRTKRGATKQEVVRTRHFMPKFQAVGSDLKQSMDTSIVQHYSGSNP